MEQAEKALREKVFNNSNQKESIIKRRKLNLDQYNIKNNFEENLRNLEEKNRDKQKEIINSYINPEKNTLYQLGDNLNYDISNYLDQNSNAINKKLLEKINELIKLYDEKTQIDKKLKQKYEIESDLRKQIEDVKKSIKKKTEETKEYEKEIAVKKEKDKAELLKLKDELYSINCEQVEAEREKRSINHELEEKNHILLKKEEELKKLRQDNLNLSEEIEYYIKGIKFQTQLHNDIQVYKNQMNNEYQEAKGNVRVFCRIRPPLPREISKKQIHIEYRGDNSLIIKGEKKASNIGREGGHQDLEQFQFNRIFKQNDTQEEVFEEVSPLIQSSLDGFNINIFAYGQTGSGKTFTMEGDMSTPQNYGIVPRSVDRIFTYFNEELKNMGWEIKFYLSVCEIYNKKTRDLIGEKNVDKTEELKEMEIHSLSEWNSNFGIIAQRRKVAETKMNMESSRSHLIFKIKIHLHNNNGIEEDRFGSLNLIDLAGSERVDKSTVSEERFKESIEINSSLTHLKSVFEAMKSKHDKFVPFHNTPLTDVLKDCLSGDNSKTLMFVNISPLLESFKESTCSLKFATDVNKCYVSGNDEGSEEDDYDDIEKNYEQMELDL